SDAFPAVRRAASMRKRREPGTQDAYNALPCPALVMTSQVPIAPSSRTSITGLKGYDFFKVIQDYLDRASKLINLEPFVATILSQPKNELIVNFPVRMDNGEVRLFKGYRVQHNNLLGPFKAGMRFHPTVTL